MTDIRALDRRGMLRSSLAGMAVGSLSLGSLAKAQAPASGGTKLYLLGTAAGPSVGGARYQTCYAVVINGEIYVLDCGYGATEQLVRAGLKLPDVKNIYITHIHPDHIADLGALIYFSWYSGKTSPLELYGPPPMKTITANYIAALQPSIDVWLDDIGHAPLEPVTAHEVSVGGPVMEDANVKVTCAVVNHPPVVPALGYRFDTADRSIVFSGDTTPVDSLRKLAQGADILVHEAIYVDALRRSGDSSNARVTGARSGSGIAGDADKMLRHVIDSHTPPEEAAKIAQAAGVKTLVFAHIAPYPPAVTEKQYIDKAKPYFDGEIIVAHDLMVM